MSIIQTILTPTLIFAGIVFVGRELFKQLLSRDIVKFKAKLEAESVQSKLRLENELQARLFEFQTKFSLYHQKQAEVIGALFEMLSETEMIIYQLVHPVQFNDGKTQQERIDEAFNKKADLAQFFERRRIYLDEDICSKMETVVRALQSATVKFHVGKMEPRSNPEADRRMLAEAWKVMEEEVPPIKKALEIKFREILSTISPAADEHPFLVSSSGGDLPKK